MLPLSITAVFFVQFVSKDMPSKNTRSMPPYIIFSNWAVTWSSQSQISILEKKKKKRLPKTCYMETENWTRHTPIISSGAGVASLSSPDSPRQTPPHKPACAGPRRCSNARSAQRETHEYLCKWSKCSSLTVNNGTCITAIVIKICNTSRDHYGAIKRMSHSVFKMT